MRRELKKRDKEMSDFDETDKIFFQDEDSDGGEGFAIWQGGVLRVMNGTQRYSPPRELLIYHRPNKYWSKFKRFYKSVQKAFIEDMILYGYFLPYWIPVASRFSCMPETQWGVPEFNHMWTAYRPYSDECFASLIDPNHA
eukprot:CAMPEP_0182439306 /NCGR_PEP_ID=MMETSP1167-20130531/86358_1 /TAXON_ID=2988 /ORGANISM="Mallomonas Sp, Strain CCMP3275" /LENGTH=139 /DNA_ID=CAMNT_0024632979 /DNA_START=696 /DNA_END=1115 /DNA_ORIENTATION=-